MSADEKYKVPLPADFFRPEDELIRSGISGPMSFLYQKLKCGCRWNLGLKLTNFIARFEGGEFRSMTLRELLKRWHGVEIGAYSYGACFLPGIFPSGTRIGRYASIAKTVRLFNANHLMDHLSLHPFFYEKKLGVIQEDAPLAQTQMVIEHDAWIGHNAIILPGCRRVGIGAVIGAGSVVTKDVPDMAIVGGNPAKLIRMRADEATIARVIASQWWERPISQIAGHMDVMLKPISTWPTDHPLWSALKK